MRGFGFSVGRVIPDLIAYYTYNVTCRDTSRRATHHQAMGNQASASTKAKFEYVDYLHQLHPGDKIACNIKSTAADVPPFLFYAVVRRVVDSSTATVTHELDKQSGTYSYTFDVEVSSDVAFQPRARSELIQQMKHWGSKTESIVDAIISYYASHPFPWVEEKEDRDKYSAFIESTKADLKDRKSNAAILDFDTTFDSAFKDASVGASTDAFGMLREYCRFYDHRIVSVAGMITLASSTDGDRRATGSIFQSTTPLPDHCAKVECGGDSGRNRYRVDLIRKLTV